MVPPEPEALDDWLRQNRLTPQAQVDNILTRRVSFHEQQTVSIQLVDSRFGSELLAGGQRTIRSDTEKFNGERPH
jgi:hypothetical protein